MTWRLCDDPAAVSVASDLIEKSVGIPAAHVEKDFWVTEALRAVAAHAHGQGTTIVFKGGTSLSKAYHLIQRFSEDIDVLVVVPGDSKSAADRCLKELSAAVGRAIGSKGRLEAASATKGRKRTVHFDYPTGYRSGGLRPSVMLELGARGGMLPAKPMTIGSLIAEHGSAAGVNVDFEEAAAFGIRVLHPTRTLVEKLMIGQAIRRSDRFVRKFVFCAKVCEVPGGSLRVPDATHRSLCMAGVRRPGPRDRA